MKDTVLASAFRSELVFALDICEEAGRCARRYFESGLDVDEKADGTPVTKADKEIEKMIREAIEAKFPDDGILGEEEEEKAAALSGTQVLSASAKATSAKVLSGSSSSSSKTIGQPSNSKPAGKSSKSQSHKDGAVRRWIIDPIDGTYNFARGITIFSTLLAFEEDGDIVAGVIHNPCYNDLYWAERGKGAFKNGERLATSDIDEMESAHFCFGGLDRIMEEGYWEAFFNIVKRTKRQRGFGDYYNFAMVFEGKAEAMLEVGVKPWDIAPMKVLAEEAGGVFCDLNGGQSIYQGSCLITNAYLAQEFKSYFLPSSSRT